MKATKVSKKGKWFDIFLLILQLVLSGSVVYLTNKILPMKLWILEIAILVLLWLIDLFLLKVLQLKTLIKRVFSRLFTIIICLVLIIANYVGYSGFDVLKRISTSTTQTHTISLVVMKDSSYQTLEDLNNCKVGYVKNMDNQYTQEAIDDIDDKGVSIDLVSIDTIENLYKALYEDQIDAMLLNEAYRGLILDINGGFDEETRVIYTYEKSEVIEVTPKVEGICEESFNVFISGIDVYGKVNKVSRSDVNMIVTINPKTKTILMTSIPRDYYVTLASFDCKDKLTHAGIYGVNESMKTLENLFGIEIPYYAKVNFTSVISIVDALGGVTVQNDEAFVSYHTQHSFPVGDIEMDGETALEFARERYGLSGGDGDRIKNHQKLLKAMINKAISPAIIVNYTSLLKSIDGSFETNVTSDDIQKLIQMQLDDGAKWTVIQNTVNGRGDSSSECYSMYGQSVYVMHPNEDSVNKASNLINQVMNGEQVSESNK